MTSHNRPTYWSKRGGPEGPWDTIVIGSGMGGMTTAGLLTRCGHKVLVLEQHYVPGGFTHAFTRGKYQWDVGVHAIGEVTTRSLLGRILHDLTGGGLQWETLGPVYDEFHYPDLRIDYPDSPHQFRANLIEAFPDEVEAIDDYLARVAEVARTMKSFLRSRSLPPSWWGKTLGRWMSRGSAGVFEKSCQEVLDEITPNKRLQAVLTSQWAYHGSPPSRASFAIQALVTRHFLHGAWYPRGGAPEIARQMLRAISEAGGWTRIRADVEEILIENQKAVGVRLADGEEIRAGRVVSAAGVMSTTRRLLPDHIDTTWARSVQDLDPGPAHVCLYLGFKGDIRSAGAGAANKWFYETWELDAGHWVVNSTQDLEPSPVLYCSFPSLKDPDHDPGPEQFHTGEAVTFVPWEVFEPWRDGSWKQREPEYEAFKKRITDCLLAQLLSHMPELEPMVDFVELSTPLSTDHFCRPIRGSIYGIEPTPARFRCEALRAHTPIKNLYFSGSEVATVGVMGAMAGGMVAAMAVEPIRVGRYMGKL
ncbi:MAG: NAD(P)/FAD-dependent oxidoreductase [Planctomycetota bacterium]|jgi:all-trans-retinol 13,14-reductase|nr:NAD(P)/FAD-dependent oxidoreductase [Planctomycetota bacterium]